MRIIQDTREQNGLLSLFPKMDGVTVEIGTLPIGDYSCRHQFNGREIPDPFVCERKSIADCFTSFSGNYEKEKAKWTKAHQFGLHYILMLEGSVTDILQGNRYWKAGEAQESRKSGLAQLRQLLTISIKYQVQLWFSSSRREMATHLVEFYLASGRWLQRQADEVP